MTGAAEAVALVYLIIMVGSAVVCITADRRDRDRETQARDRAPDRDRV